MSDTVNMEFNAIMKSSKYLDESDISKALIYAAIAIEKTPKKDSIIPIILRRAYTVAENCSSDTLSNSHCYLTPGIKIQKRN